MPEPPLKRPGITYSACGLFNKNKERTNRRFKIYLSNRIR